MKHTRRESALEAWAVKWARFRGVIVAKMGACDGIPDRIFFVPGGKPIVGEFKALGELPSVLQDWYLKKLAADGYTAHCWDDKKSFLLAMKAGGLDGD